MTALFWQERVFELTGPSKAGAGCGSGEAQVVSDIKFFKCRVVVIFEKRILFLKGSTPDRDDK